MATPQNRVPELKVGDSMVQPPICRPELLFHLCSFWKSAHSFRTVRILSKQTQLGGTSTLLLNGEFSLWMHIHQLSLRWIEIRASKEVTMSFDALWRLRAAQSRTAIFQAKLVQQCHNVPHLRLAADGVRQIIPCVSLRQVRFQGRPSLRADAGSVTGAANRQLSCGPFQLSSIDRIRCGNTNQRRNKPRQVVPIAKNGNRGIAGSTSQADDHPLL